MIISGGRARNIQEILPTEVYDTELSEWSRFQGIGLYRHSCFLKDSTFFIYGGFENSSPNFPVEKLSKIDVMKYFSAQQTLCLKIEKHLTKETPSEKNSLNSIKENISLPANGTNILLKNNNLNIFDQNSKQDQKFRLASQAVVVKCNENVYDEMGMIRKVSIDKLNDEAKRIGYQNIRSQIHPRRIYNEDLINKFIETLLRPFDWFTPEVEEMHQNFPFSSDEIDQLINEAVKLIPRDPTLVKLRSPVKVFGNLFGQYEDLMRFFESYGHPSDDNQKGDIHMLQYVFLGDFCDRGHYSLEIILLLLALKVNLFTLGSLPRSYLHHQRTS
jgi:protein phosphatase